MAHFLAESNNIIVVITVLLSKVARLCTTTPFPRQQPVCLLINTLPTNVDDPRFAQHTLVAGPTTAHPRDGQPTVCRRGSSVWRWR